MSSKVGVLQLYYNVTLHLHRNLVFLRSRAPFVLQFWEQILKKLLPGRPGRHDFSIHNTSSRTSPISAFQFLKVKRNNTRDLVLLHDGWFDAAAEMFMDRGHTKIHLLFNKNSILGEQTHTQKDFLEGVLIHVGWSDAAAEMFMDRGHTKNSSPFQQKLDTRTAHTQKDFFGRGIERSFLIRWKER
ncbi:hypothetical protein CEXT_448171 [Caerostris extrusa]|uniref:Uncharacterized protein n=1 Tax=Caerostris extrusa TaxID=172846 RepID=A0AAV4XQZ3_CAEEX|nr:hypothetical protein CEXT_448171 [Caerostris extrusa]